MADMPSFQFSSAADQAANLERGRSFMPTLQVDGGNGRNGTIDPGRWGDTGNIGEEIPAVLGSLFQPKIDQLKTEKFWEGFTQARAAGTAEQIQKDQPWFANIFGPTPYAMGADTFAVQKATADVETRFHQSMPELRQLPPEQIGKALNDMSQDAMTGDAYTDALIQKNMLDRAGPMMEAHTKARYAWQQETLASGQYDARDQATTAYQTAMVAAAKLGTDHPGQAPTPESQAEMTRNLLQVFQMPSDQDPKAGMDAMLKSIGAAADDGKWYAVNALQDSGLLGKLPVDVQDKIQSRIDRASAKSQLRVWADPVMSKAVAQFRSQVVTGRLSPAATMQGMENLNRQYMAMTGNRDNPLYPMDKLEAGVSTAAELVYRAEDKAADALLRRREKADTAEQKAAAAAQTDALLAQAASTGALGSTILKGQASNEDADRALMGLVKASPSSLSRIAVANATAPQRYVSESLKTQLTNGISLAAGQEYTDAFGKAYEQWADMRYQTHTVNDPITHAPSEVPDPNGYGTARMYYGADNTDRMQRFDDMTRSGLPKEIAYQRTFGAESTFGNANLQGVDITDTQANVAAVKDVVDEHGDRWFAADMPDSAKRVLTQIVGREFQAIKSNAPELSADDTAKQAFLVAQHEKGLEVAGKYVWTDNPGQKSLPQFLRMTQPDKVTPREDFNNVFDAVMTAKFNAQGVSIDNDTDYTVARLGDDANGPRLLAIAYDGDGSFKSVWFTGEDLKTVRDELARADIKKARIPFSKAMYHSH